MRYTEITEVPELPPEIRQAVDSETLAVFIGAGVSQLLGCKGWEDLAREVAKRCYKTQKSDGKRCISFREKNSLLQERDFKKTITICYHLLEQAGEKEAFFEEFDRCLGPEGQLTGTPEIYDELYRLHGLFITTNADGHFDRLFTASQVFFRMEDFGTDNIGRNRLYHIHGHHQDRESLVFTVDEYIKRYNDDTFRNFLSYIFGGFTVLFVGYGISEYEIIDYLFVKTQSTAKARPMHFVLRGYFKGEEQILRIEQQYYKRLGLTVVPFAKDKHGYEQLYPVIKEWAKEVFQTSAYLLDTHLEIKRLVHET